MFLFQLVEHTYYFENINLQIPGDLVKFYLGVSAEKIPHLL